MKKIQVRLAYDQDLEQYLNQTYSGLKNYRLISKALDARGASRGKKPHFNYQLEIVFEGEVFEKESFNFPQKSLTSKPIIIGAGPAGLFAAQYFADSGVPCVILERGDEALTRMRKIAKFWRYGELDPESNVCFGEGGAGLFSDGKLITRVKHPEVGYVLRRLVDFGAPEEITYQSNPHLGSNRIRSLIQTMRESLRAKGVEIHFRAKVSAFLFKDGRISGVKLSDGREFFSKHIILAAGHSAHDIYQYLKKQKVSMQQKDFAIGVRIEHPRLALNQMQFGNFSGAEELGAARYRLSMTCESKKGVYSFCMCPGGYVLSSGTEVDGLVSNGMSNSACNSPWSNGALVVTVKAGVDFSEDDILEGLKFTREIENKAFSLSTEKGEAIQLPAMTIKEFLAGKLNSRPLPKTSVPGGIFKQDLSEILPAFVVDSLKEALLDFDKKIPGFSSSGGLLIAPETRTSAPVTILRNRESLESESHPGLYPCGEGAGYAGGITSAAVDGVRVAKSILK